MSPILLSELPNEGISSSPGSIFHIMKDHILPFFCFMDLFPMFTIDIQQMCICISYIFLCNPVVFLYIFEQVPKWEGSLSCIVGNKGETIAGCSMFKQQQMMAGGNRLPR